MIVDNNLSTIPDTLASLTSLHTLWFVVLFIRQFNNFPNFLLYSLDGNLINDVDNITRSLPLLCSMFTSC